MPPSTGKARGGGGSKKTARKRPAETPTTEAAPKKAKQRFAVGKTWMMHRKLTEDGWVRCESTDPAREPKGDSIVHRYDRDIGFLRHNQSNST